MAKDPPRGMFPKKEKDWVVRTPVNCLQCRKTATLVQVAETIPLFGKILIQSYACAHCGFKWSDAMSLEFNEPLGFEARIEKEEDLKIKLVRNSSGTIEIPELGVWIEPGPFAEGFYTNMEGLLERVESVLKLLEKSEDKKQAKEAKERMKQLKKCRNAEMKFTVRVLDPFGGSAMIGKKVRHFKLTKKDLVSLKRGSAVSDS